MEAVPWWGGLVFLVAWGCTSQKAALLVCVVCVSLEVIPPRKPPTRVCVCVCDPGPESP